MLAIDISSMGSPEQKLNWAFRMYDINGDGYVQPNEMIEIITVGTRARGHEYKHARGHAWVCA